MRLSSWRFWIHYKQGFTWWGQEKFLMGPWRREIAIKYNTLQYYLSASCRTTTQCTHIIFQSSSRALIFFLVAIINLEIPHPGYRVVSEQVVSPCCFFTKWQQFKHVRWFTSLELSLRNYSTFVPCFYSCSYICTCRGISVSLSVLFKMHYFIICQAWRL